MTFRGSDDYKDARQEAQKVGVRVNLHHEGRKEWHADYRVHNGSSNPISRIVLQIDDPAGKGRPEWQERGVGIVNNVHLTRNP